MPDSGDSVRNSDVSLLPQRGMITIRGRFGSARFKAAVQTVFGLGVPPKCGISDTNGTEIAWMSPDELLVLLPHEEVAQALDLIESELSGEHCLAVDVSDLRVGFKITGPVRDILAKGTPADMSAEAFHRGHFIRSRLGQVSVAFWLTGENSARLICRRSEAEFVQGWLELAASPERAPNYYHN